MRCLLVVALAMLVVAEEPRLQSEHVVNPIVDRFLSRPDEPIWEYRAVRRLEATVGWLRIHGWMEVETVLTADGAWDFHVLREGGVGWVRDKGLRTVLQREKELVESDHTRLAITPANYDLTLVDDSSKEPDLYKIRALPLREERGLMDGVLFVTKEGSLVRTEGRLPVNPSRVITNVKFTRVYGRIAGINVPIETSSTASVLFKLGGSTKFTMSYSYTSINGISIDPEEDAQTNSEERAP